MIDRRTFIGAVPGAFLIASRVAEAQQTGKVYRIGLVAATPPVTELAGPEPVGRSWRALVQGLRALGYVEGQNLILERRSAYGQIERGGEIVAELVRLKVDVIVIGTDGIARAAKVVTATVPIVLPVSGDPVGDGFARSLARPGGNITGLTFGVGPEIEGKRFELLCTMLPGLSRVVYLGSKEEQSWESPRGKSVRKAAQDLGVTLVLAEFSFRQYTDAFAQISRARPQALFVARSARADADRAPIVDFATRNRLPSSTDYREWVELGGLMSYGANPADNFRRAATYVDKILKGAKPADLPIEQPTRFELVINLKTARALGLTVPQSLLLRADEVIQ